MKTLFLPTLFVIVSSFSVYGNNFSTNNLPPKKDEKKESKNEPEKVSPTVSNIAKFPVELNVTRRNGKIEFLWTHNSNSCPCKYTLQRSDDNENFIDISVQNTNGANIGDIFYDIDSEYRSIEDKKYYRLKVADNQGNEACSAVIKS